MTELTKRVKYPEYTHYVVDSVDGDPCAVQRFLDRYPDFAGQWIDLSDYTPDDLDEMDAALKELHVTLSISDHAKDVPDDNDAA